MPNIFNLPAPEGFAAFATGICRNPEVLLRDAGLEMPVLPVQTHSVNVSIATRRDETFPSTDALITFEKGLPIAVRTADCVPILLFAPDIRAIAAVHAGWKGSLGGIVDNTIDRLIEYGADTSLMSATFGSSVCGECYEVDEDLAERFIIAGFRECVTRPGGLCKKPHLDLQMVNCRWMLRRGIPAANIHLNTLCTRCATDAGGRHLFNSWRRLPGTPDRNLTIAVIK